MPRTRRTYALTALAAAMLAVPAVGAAADNEEEIDLTPLITPENNVAVGIGQYAGDREQFGVYDGVRDAETVILLDGEAHMRDEASGTWTTATFRNLGLDSREATFGVERQGDWGLNLRYNQIPRFAPYTVNTGLQGIGSDSLIISDPSITPGNGTDIVLGTTREIVGIDMFKYLAPRLSFKIDFKNEEKEGTRHWGRGGAPEFAVEPIDWSTQQVEMLLNYAGKKFQMAGGYYGSWFSNANTLVDTIRTGADPTVLANHFYLSLPLDNQAHQFFVDGGYGFTPTTRGSFKLSYTRATQDERMPTADIAGLSAAGAPSRLDGRVDTILGQLGLSARPLPNLHVVANLRYHDVNDKTPAWLVVNTATAHVHSTPLSYETLSGKLEGTYRLPAGFSFTAGVDQKNQDRTIPVGDDFNPVDGFDDERYVPFRAELDETTYRVQLRRSLSDNVNGSLGYSHSERDGSNFSEATHSLGGINPVNIADRDRDKVRMTVDWIATDRLNLQVNAEHAQDDYGPETNPYGLLEGTAQVYSLDADFSISDKWQLTAWLSHDRTEAEQFTGRWTNNTDVHEADKLSELKDVGNSVGMGLRGRPSSKVTVGADLQWTRTKSQYQDTVVVDTASVLPAYPPGMSPLPDIENNIARVGVFSEYVLRKNMDLRIDLIHERWRTDDWSWQFSDGSPFVYSTTFDGTTINQRYHQQSTFVGVRYIFKFR